MLRCFSGGFCSIFSRNSTISAPTITWNRFQWYLRAIEERFSVVERLLHSYSLINTPKIWKMNTETRKGNFYVYYDPHKALPESRYAEPSSQKEALSLKESKRGRRVFGIS